MLKLTLPVHLVLSLLLYGCFPSSHSPVPLSSEASQFIGLLGCPALDAPPRASRHSIYVDGYGHLLNPVTEKPISNTGNVIKDYNAENLYIDRILSDFACQRRNDPNLKLTLFIHGGLNQFKDATTRARKYTNQMLADGQYPVFISWDSGFQSNYFDHLFRIRKGLSTPVLGVPSAPFVLLEDIARSLSRIPASVYKEFKTPLVVTIAVKTEDERDYESREDALSKLGFDVQSSEPFRGVAGDYWTIWNPLKLLGAPLVDGFGTGAWDGMLRRTDLVLTKSSAFEGNYLPVGNAAKSKKTSYETQRGEDARIFDTAATLFLKRIEDFGDNAPQLNIIAHSMGSIVAVNILARHPSLRVNNLVFMGAAARVKDVENVVVPWLLNNPDSQFWNLSLDPYREMGENNYLDIGPRGSLLNWIDFTFGEVNSYKDRTAGSWWNITRIAEDIFPKVTKAGLPQTTTTIDKDTPADASRLRARVHLVRFPIGKNCQWPQAHGEFDDYQFWKEDYWNSGGLQAAATINQMACSPYFVERSLGPDAARDWRR